MWPATGSGVLSVPDIHPIILISSFSHEDFLHKKTDSQPLAVVCGFFASRVNNNDVGTSLCHTIMPTWPFHASTCLLNAGGTGLPFSEMPSRTFTGLFLLKEWGRAALQLEADGIWSIHQEQTLALTCPCLLVLISLLMHEMSRPRCSGSIGLLVRVSLDEDIISAGQRL